MRDYAAWHAWLEARRATPFAWGTNDCVTFATGAVEALTGRRAMEGIGRWANERSALRALARAGGMIAAVSSVLDTVPIALAHRGDIAAVEDERGIFLMVIDGVNLIGPGVDGSMALNRERAIHAWSAGG